MSEIPAGEMCCATIGWNGRCRNRAKMRHNGGFFCGTHDPVKRAEKQRANHELWRAKWEKETRMQARNRKIESAKAVVVSLARAAAAGRLPWSAVAGAVAALAAAEDDAP